MIAYGVPNPPAPPKSGTDVGRGVVYLDEFGRQIGGVGEVVNPVRLRGDHVEVRWETGETGRYARPGNSGSVLAWSEDVDSPKRLRDWALKPILGS